MMIMPGFILGHLALIKAYTNIRPGWIMFYVLYLRDWRLVEIKLQQLDQFGEVTGVENDRVLGYSIHVRLCTAMNGL